MNKDNEWKSVLLAQLGKPYLFGGKWPLNEINPKGGVDCSGFSRWAYSLLGQTIPEGSQAQFAASKPCDAKLGALGFFRNDEGMIHHVGVLLDDGNVIEARGEPYDKVILRPQTKWEAWHEFAGWRAID